MAEKLPLEVLLRRRVFRLEVPVRFDEKEAAEELAKTRKMSVAKLVRFLLQREIEKEGTK